MKQKPYQGKAFLCVVLAVSCLSGLAYPTKAQATGIPGTPATSPPLSCPIPNFTGETSCVNCCPAPELLLQAQFRGPGIFYKSLDDWYTEDFFPILEEGLAGVSAKIKETLSAETAAIGSFMSAQNTIRTQSSLEKASAKAARDHLMSEAMCRYATLSQGLGASEANADAIKQQLITRSFDRQLLKTGVTSGEDVEAKNNESPVTRGQSADKNARWKKFISTFCDASDISFSTDGNGNNGTSICAAQSTEQANRDVDFARTVDMPLTLDITPLGENTADIQNITALEDNLYAHDIMNNAQNSQSLDPSISGNNQNIRNYFQMRSAIAKRSVAENSFAALTAMKARGAPESAAYVKSLMQELGLSKEAAETMVGVNPSYYAQMETLSRKLYQSPAFYINLMEGPANVERQQAAMKSIELMQQRDIYKSMARSEMLLATLLEIYVARQQSGADKVLVQSTE